MLEPTTPPQVGLESISTRQLAQHIQRLASDEFEGRFPGSRGEELTLDYLTEQFQNLGLDAAIGAPGFRQQVPFMGMTPVSQPELVFRGSEREGSFPYGEGFVTWTKRAVERILVEDSPVWFVGHGVVAPEYDWDDFKGADLEGKTLIVLVNDPPVPDPTDPTRLDETVFRGRAMTYYGRWTYKMEMAAQEKAAACLIVHETGRAGYPWDVVQNSWSGQHFDLVSADRNMGRCQVEGWLSYESALQIFQLAGQDLVACMEAARRRDFSPLPLDLAARLGVENKLHSFDSHNLVAKLEGSDPQLKDQYVVYMAHWDHLGKNPNLQGDPVYHGAVDNASGTAGLLEIAKAFARLPTPPRRSLLFLCVTGEEQGLLGSRYYSDNPLYPLARTAAVLNMDGMNVLGPTEDITIIGQGNSSLDEEVMAVAREQGRSIRPDPHPEKGFFFRSDHFNFAKKGVPSLYLDPGINYLGKPEGWGLKVRERYIRECYHKPADRYDPGWDLTGMVQDLQLLFQVGYRIANQETYPEWKSGSEFAALRERMLKDAGLDG